MGYDQDSMIQILDYYSCIGYSLGKKKLVKPMQSRLLDVSSNYCSDSAETSMNPK